VVEGRLLPHPSSASRFTADGLLCGVVQKIALIAIVDQALRFKREMRGPNGQAAIWVAGSSVGSLLHADAPPQVTQEGEMIEFLAQMPTHTMIFLTMAVLGLAATLIALKWRI
jgi:hypothetical protein